MRRTIIMLSSVPWGGLFQRPHHIAYHLSEIDHNVIFVNPNGLTAKIKNVDLLRDMQQVFNASLSKMQKVKTNLQVITPIKVLEEENTQKSINIYIESVQYLVNHYSKYGSAVVICYLPDFYPILDKLRYMPSIIYDCVDEHVGTYWSTPNTAQYEKKLLAIADAVLTTSNTLFVRKGKDNADTFLVKNAVWTEHFFKPADIPDDIARMKRPIAGYIGAIAEWFDYEWMIYAARNNPNINFALIGPVIGNLGWISKLPDNIKYLGPKAYNEIPAYYKSLDVGIIPFRVESDVIINCNPIKFYEYCAAGIPVVTTPLPELACYNKNLTTAYNKEQFSQGIRELINKSYSKTSLKEIAVDNSWEKRVDMINKIINYEILPDRRGTLEHISAEYKSFLEVFPDSKLVKDLLDEVESEIRNLI